MLAKTYTATLEGIEGEMTSVEVNLSRGIPCIHVVGSTDKVVRESAERIRAAMINTGIRFPVCRITVNLAPAEITKHGSHYDLAISVALMLASESVDPVVNVRDYAFFGELSLEGEISHVRGMLPLAMCAEDEGIGNIVVPYDDRNELSLLQRSRVIPVRNLRQVIDLIQNGTIPEYEEKTDEGECISAGKKDFDQVYGQEAVKRAMVVSAAGGHSMLLMGSPGVGKSMMAERYADILPPLTYEEQVEITRIHSIGGLLGSGSHVVRKRPFRNPGNTVTATALLGGGREPRPGEISYAHGGVLFLDEFSMFDSNLIQLMRKPAEEKKIVINRNRRSYTFPADNILICAANPCRCGYRGDPVHICTCSQRQLDQFFSRLSGPFVDRIDMHVRMSPVDFREIEKNRKGIGTAEMREMVIYARRIQEERYRGMEFSLNSRLSSEDLKKYVPLDRECRRFVGMLYEKMGFSVRTYGKILALARTVADVEGEEKVNAIHIAEAVQYRNMTELYRNRGENM